MKTFVLVSTLLLLSSCGKEEESQLPPAPTAESAKAPTGPTGRIRGMVLLKGNVPAPKFEAITENQNVCGDKVAVTRLAVGKDKGVRYAFVYLDDVKSSDSFRP